MIVGDPYLENQVMTATPQQLHLMVVDGAIRFARRAQQALIDKDYETAHFSLNHSREFVAELITGLDPAHTPDIVDQLKALFAFIYRNLALADLEHDAKRVEDALRILQLHRETWMALCERLTQTQSDTAPKLPPESRSWTT